MDDRIVNLAHPFPQTVVHDNQWGPDGSKKGRCARAIERALTARLIQGDHAEPVHWTGRLHFF
jgi:hypothetical protein